MAKINGIFQACSGICTWTRDGSGNWTVTGTCTAPCSCYDPNELATNPSPHPGQSGGPTLTDAVFLGKIALYDLAADDARSLRRRLGPAAAPDRRHAIFTSKSGTSTAAAPQAGDVYETDCYEP